LKDNSSLKRILKIKINKVLEKKIKKLLRTKIKIYKFIENKKGKEY